MPDPGQQWELFGYDMRNVGRHWLAAWRDLLWGSDSPLRFRLDEAVTLQSELGTACYQAGQPSDVSGATCQAVLLPGELVLSKTLQLPAAVEAELESALALEVSASSPFAADDTSHGWRVITRDEQQITVALVIVSMSAVMAYLGRRYDSHDPHAQEAWAEVAGQMVVIRGFGETEREGRYQRRLLRVGALSIAAALILLLMSGVSVFYKGIELERVQELARKVQLESGDASRMRESLSMANDTVATVNRTLVRHPSPHIELARITRLLGDDVFVERFNMTGTEIELRGRARDAAEVMKELTAQDDYQEVTATRPISVIGSTGIEQFYLRIVLRQGEQG